MSVYKFLIKPSELKYLTLCAQLYNKNSYLFTNRNVRLRPRNYQRGFDNSMIEKMKDQIMGQESKKNIKKSKRLNLINFALSRFCNERNQQLL